MVRVLCTLFLGELFLDRGWVSVWFSAVYVPWRNRPPREVWRWEFRGLPEFLLKLDFSKELIQAQ
jgi:hypothetical protein